MNRGPCWQQLLIQHLAVRRVPRPPHGDFQKGTCPTFSVECAYFVCSGEMALQLVVKFVVLHMTVSENGPRVESPSVSSKWRVKGVDRVNFQEVREWELKPLSRE